MALVLIKLDLVFQAVDRRDAERAGHAELARLRRLQSSELSLHPSEGRPPFRGGKTAYVARSCMVQPRHCRRER